MAENSDNQLIDWLADRCGISQLRACELSTKIRKEHGIDGIISLKEMVLSVPNALSVLGLPIFVQKTLESKLSQSENKLLDSLTPQEVYNALRNLFPANKLVASSFLSSKISGYVLETAETAKQLRLWGVDSADDADELLRQLNLWRVNGVPPAFFCFHKDTSTYPHHLDTTPVQPLMASDDNSPADHLTLHKKKRGRPPKAKTAEADGIHAKRSAEDHTQQQKQQKLTTPTLTPAQPGGSVQPHLQPKSKPQPQPQLQPQLQRESQSKRRIMAPLSSAVRDPARPSSRRKRPRIQNDEEEQDGDLNGGDGSDGNDDDNGGGGGSLNGGHHNEEDQEGAGERAHTPREMVDAEVDISALCTLRKKFNAGTLDCAELIESGALKHVIDASKLRGDVAKKTLALVQAILLRAPPALRMELLTKHGLLEFALQNAHSSTHSVRIAAVGLLKEITGTEGRSLLFSQHVVQAILRSYFSSVQTSDAKKCDTTRAGYVALLTCLCTPLTTAPVLTCSVPPPSLWPSLLPILRDVLHHDRNTHTIFPAACQALMLLLQGSPEEAGGTLKAYKLVDVLVERLGEHSAQPTIAHLALQCLTRLTALLSDAESSCMYAAFDAVKRLLLARAATPPTRELVTQVGCFAEKFVTLGPAAVALVVTHHAEVFEALCSLLHGDVALEELPVVQQAARTVLQTAEEGAMSEATLSTLLQLGLYPALFRILAVLPPDLPGNTDLVLRALECLHMLVKRVENLEAVHGQGQGQGQRQGQEHCEEARRVRWRRVAKLACGEGSSLWEDGKVKMLAGRLLVTARTLNVAT